MAASVTAKQALVPVFATLYRTVVLGLWQTLETIPWAIWLLSNAFAARREGPRLLVLILVVAGVLNAAIALYRLIAAS